MKESLIISILTFVTWAALGQIGTISVNGRKFEGNTAKVSYFKFDPFDTLLTKTTIEYLNEFGNAYKDSVHGKQNYLIELAPGLANDESDANGRLDGKRLMVVINYLENTFGINRSEFRARFSETVTISCEAYLANGRHKRKLKKKKNK